MTNERVQQRQHQFKFWISGCQTSFSLKNKYLMWVKWNEMEGSLEISEMAPLSTDIMTSYIRHKTFYHEQYDAWQF